MKNNQLKERMAAFAASVRKKPYAAAIAAAAVVLAAVLFFVMGPPADFLRNIPGSDGSGHGAGGQGERGAKG